MAIAVNVAPRAVVTIGDSFLAGGRGRRSVASRLAELLRGVGGPILPLDRSGGGLLGALDAAAALLASTVRPHLVVVCLGWNDAPGSPAPTWWIPDAVALLDSCRAGPGSVVLVLAPVPERCGARGKRWHRRMREELAKVACVPILDLGESEVGKLPTPAQSAWIAEQVAALAD